MSKVEEKAAKGEARSEKLGNKQYTKELRRLQTELCHLQAWVKHKGLRVIVVFEGRDGAVRVGPFGRSRSG